MFKFNQPLLCISSHKHRHGEAVYKGEVYRFARVNSWGHENVTGKTHILFIGTIRHAFPVDYFVPLTEELMATKLFKLIEKIL